MPEYAQALFEGIRYEIERVYWNREQVEWDQHADPKVPEVEWRPYYWGDDEAVAELPNFAFEGVEIRWYKYPGRGMSTNKAWKPAEWTAWFERCLAAVRASEGQS